MIKEEEIKVWAIVGLFYLPTFPILFALNELPALVFFGAAFILTIIVILIIKKKRIWFIGSLYAIALGLSIFAFWSSIYIIYVYNGLNEDIVSLQGYLPGSPMWIESDVLESDSHFGMKYRPFPFHESFTLEGQVDGEELIFEGAAKKLDGRNRFAIEITRETVKKKII